MSNKPRFMLCPRCWGSMSEPKSHDKCTRCNGAGSEEDHLLTKNFWLSEFLYSPVAVRLGIPNDPSDESIRRLILVACALEPIREAFGPLRINSGFRSSLLNISIGGSRSSAHCHAYAADVDPLDPNVRHYEVMKWLLARQKADSKHKLDQVIYEGTWLHIGLIGPGDAVRGQALMMFPEKTSARRMVSRYYAWNEHDRRVVI